MRTVKLQMQVSIDGYCAGPQGEMDWMTWNWDDELKEYVSALTKPVDTILLGRKLASGFIPHWAQVAENREDPSHSFGKVMHETKKVVFSKTLGDTEWKNTVLAKDDLTEEVKRLQTKPGGDIIVYGGSLFVSNLIRENLIDKYYLFVNPATLGSGLPVFTNRKAMKLAEARSFSCGIVVLEYHKA